MPRLASESRGALLALNSASIRIGLLADTALVGMTIAHFGFTLMGPVTAALAILSAVAPARAVPR